jgi:phosphoglycerate kinase
MKTLGDQALSGQTVLLRCELNVAFDNEGVPDLTRIEASRPTIDLLRDAGCRVVVCSHMGRPWGQRDPSKSLRQLVEPLATVLGGEVRFADDCIGPGRNEAIASLPAGGVLLLENVRYYAEENDNDASFGAALAEGIDLYVQDAFGNCHRPHASMVAAPLAAPNRCAGLLLERELHALRQVDDPALRPTLAIIGGAKVSGKDGKIGVVQNLLPKVDQVAIVGKLAYFFLLAQGIGVGETLTGDTRGFDAPDSSLDADLAACREVLAEAESLGRPPLLPADSVINRDGADSVVDFSAGEVAADARAFDIGPATVAAVNDAIADAKLTVWNGPAGFFERAPYNQGTLAIARSLIAAPGHAVIGGGDTVAAVVSELHEDNAQIHICTGGGAMLTWLMGVDLPGVAALN